LLVYCSNSLLEKVVDDIFSSVLSGDISFMNKSLLMLSEIYFLKNEYCAINSPASVNCCKSSVGFISNIGKLPSGLNTEPLGKL
jgi:hypothetical protein